MSTATKIVLATLVGAGVLSALVIFQTAFV